MRHQALIAAAMLAAIAGVPAYTSEEARADPPRPRPKRRLWTPSAADPLATERSTPTQQDEPK